ncbi:629_t:CDS:2, partial [Cetraspora pellucida]
HSKNILIHQKSIKLADFGLSKRLGEATNSNKNILGVIQYIDPQRFKASRKRKINESGAVNFSFNKQSDIYSVGILMWEISSGHPPFERDSYDSVFIKSMQGVREEVIKGTPPAYAKIYEDCWQVNPNMRPTIENVFSDLNALKVNNEDQMKIDASQKSCSLQTGDLIGSINTEP